MNTMQLTTEDLQIILESLLFTAIPSVNINSYRDDVESMLKLALSIRKQYPSVFTKNTYIHKLSSEIDQFSEYTEYFPELELN